MLYNLNIFMNKIVKGVPAGVTVFEISWLRDIVGVS